MKNIYLPIAVVLSILAFLAAGCISPLSPPVEPQAGSAAAEGEGILRVTLGNGARTVLPDTAGLYYVLTLTPQGGGEAVTADITGEPPVERSLKAGRWDLEVKGYISQAAMKRTRLITGSGGPRQTSRLKLGKQAR